MKKMALDFLFPQQCCGCGQVGLLLCESCRGSLQRVPPSCFVCKRLVPARERVPAGRTCKMCRPSSSVYAFFSPLAYQDKPMKNMIHALKYGRAQELAEIFADMLARDAAKFGVSFPADALLIPIPLDPIREQRRGFNQAELIAKQLGARWELEVASGALAHQKKKTAQALLDARGRWNEIYGTFAVREPARIQGSTVCVIDDVKTTGATIEEASRVLKAAGAKRILAISVAH